MGRLRGLLLTGLILVLASAGATTATATSADQVGQTTAAAVQVPAADTPSPSLGSTPQPGVNPPGDSDADPSDFNEVRLVLIAFLVLAALIGGALLFYLWRRRTREQVRRTHDAGSHQDR